MRLMLAFFAVCLMGGCTSPASPREVELLRQDLGTLRWTPERTRSSATTYRVQRGDTLWSLARRWGVSVTELKQANGLTADTIRVGEELVIPPVGGAILADETGLTWPVPSSHRGRGAGRARRGSAPEGAGRVSYVSESVRGLGKVVMVEHPDGLLTLYGLLGDAAVTMGQGVRRGQPIGRIGPGGPTTGPRLSFMVFREGRAAPVEDYLNW